MPDDDPYKSLLKKEFNTVVAENAMKPVSLAAERGKFEFKNADSLVAFARANGMKVRGHCLVWHQQIPAWMNNDQLSREELFNIMKEYITTVVTHFKGKIFAWDVVNEAINEKEADAYRNTVWKKVLGPAYIDSAFVWAHRADPSALLIYNDYDIEDMGRKSNAVFDLVKGMKARHIPIDGVGLQCHFQLGRINPVEMKANMDRIAGLGLQTQITELDIAVPSDQYTKENFEKQAEEYGQVMTLFLQDKNCSSLMLWGLTDRFSWIPGFSKNKRGGALIFAEDYGKKPAYHTFLKLLKNKVTKK
jgi:endo-1,4-beta-xylanase